MSNDIQHQTDVEKAKTRLAEVQQSKDPRFTNQPPLTPASLPAAKDGGPVKKEIRPVSAKPKKKKFGQKLKEAMFSEDIGNGSVTEYVFFRIFVPSVKEVVSKMLNTAINMALGLDPKSRVLGGSSSNPHTANASIYRDRNFNRPRDNTIYNQRMAISELEWDEETAKDIYNQIREMIDTYGECSIADVYSLMNLGSKIRSTDNKWGWTSMNEINAYPVDALGERWIIDVPSARALRY